MKKKLKRICALFLSICTIIMLFLTPVRTLAVEDGYEAFLNKLGYYESRNTYNIKNEYGYLGRWQIGMESLKDIGFVDSNGQWTALANSMGVYSTEDFLKTPAAQDYAIRLYDKKLWSYIQYFGDDDYIGTEFNGITVTLSGLVAAAHLVGAGGIHQMFMTGRVPSDALGNECTFYLKNLAGYDISGFLGADISKYLNSAIKSKSKIKKIQNAMRASTVSSKINLYGNTSECNYLMQTDFSQNLNEKIYYSRDKKIYTISIDKKNRHNGYNSLKISGKAPGEIGKDVSFLTDTNGNVSNDKYIGDYKKMTISFYAKSSVDSVNMFWRFGYAKEAYEPIKISSKWKKYSLTVTKENSFGSILYMYLNKSADVYISEMMLVDGEKVPTLFRCETSKCIKTVQATYLSSYGGLPSPKREGYIFKGWYTSKSGGKKVDSTTPAYDKSLNLYAHWEKISKYIPDKATEYNGHYYTVFTDDLSWQQAQEACKKMGGYLVVINSMQENQMIVDLCSEMTKSVFWIGAYSDKDGKFKWVNSEEMTFEAWDKNQNEKKAGKYAQIYTEHYENNEHIGKWNSMTSTDGAISFYGTKNVGYICEFDPDNVKLPIKTTSNESSTYSLYEGQIGWYNANYFCRSNSANLVTINSQAENKVVAKMISGTKNDAYWMGATNLKTDGVYEWTTSQEFEYENWCAKNPTNLSSQKGTDHFVMMMKNGQWNDIRSIGPENMSVGFVMEKDDNLPQISQLRLSIDSNFKRCYNVGDVFKTNGLHVVAVYDNSATDVIDEGYSVYPTVFEKSGLQDVTVEYGSFKKTLKVYVLKSDDSIRVTDCCFKKSSISVSVGKKTSQDIIFNPDDAECKYASWTSSDESVARVDENGVITGISKGTAIITAYTFDGQFEDYYVVKVKRSFGQWAKYYILFGWTKKQ